MIYYADSVFTAWAMQLFATSTTVKGRFACSIASTVTINRRQLGVLMFADTALLDTFSSDTQVSTTQTGLQDDSLGFTKLYFRNTNAVTGPTGEVSPDSDYFPGTPGDKNTPKDMTTAKGTAQTSVSGAYNNAGANRMTMCRIFVGPPLGAQTLTGGQANYKVGLGIRESSNSMDLYGRVFVYIWRPGSGNVKSITSSPVSCPSEHGSAQERECIITFTGASGDFSIQANDRIVVEIWWDIKNTGSTSYTATDYYDGTTEMSADGTAASDAAAFFSCTQTLYSAATIQRTTTEYRELLVVAMGTKRFGTTDSDYGMCYGINIDSNDRANSRGTHTTGGTYASSVATAYAENLAAGSHTIKGRFATNNAGGTTIVDSRRIVALWLYCPPPPVPEFPFGVLILAIPIVAIHLLLRKYIILPKRFVTSSISR